MPQGTWQLKSKSPACLSTRKGGGAQGNTCLRAADLTCCPSLPRVFCSHAPVCERTSEVRLPPRSAVVSPVIPRCPLRAHQQRSGTGQGKDCTPWTLHCEPASAPLAPLNPATHNALSTGTNPALGTRSFQLYLTGVHCQRLELFFSDYTNFK